MRTSIRFRALLKLLLLIAAVSIMNLASAALPEGNGGKNSASLSVLVTPETFSEKDLGALGTVTLKSSDTSEATVAASVEIPVGEVSAEFLVLAEDDTDEDGDQSVTISVSATDHSAATAWWSGESHPWMMIPWQLPVAMSSTSQSLQHSSTFYLMLDMAGRIRMHEGK